MKSKKIDELIAKIKSDTWDEKRIAGNALALVPTPKVVMALVSLLYSDNVDVRNATALALRKIRSKKAVPFLIEAIKRPRNKDHIGTLVYALETHDCSKYFLEIIKLALSVRPFVSASAVTILTKQGFWMKNKDVDKALKLLNNAILKGNIEADKSSDFKAYLMGLYEDEK